MEPSDRPPKILLPPLPRAPFQEAEGGGDGTCDEEDSLAFWNISTTHALDAHTNATESMPRHTAIMSPTFAKYEHKSEAVRFQDARPTEALSSTVHASSCFTAFGPTTCTADCSGDHKELCVKLNHAAAAVTYLRDENDKLRKAAFPLRDENAALLMELKSLRSVERRRAEKDSIASAKIEALQNKNAALAEEVKSLKDLVRLLRRDKDSLSMDVASNRRAVHSYRWENASLTGTVAAQRRQIASQEEWLQFQGRRIYELERTLSTSSAKLSSSSNPSAATAASSTNGVDLTRRHNNNCYGYHQQTEGRSSKRPRSADTSGAATAFVLPVLERTPFS